MNYMEVLNILNKVGIDADAARFSQESFEYSDPFWSFDEYIRKNYPDFKYEVCSGATKVVIVPKNEDWVLKIPFAGYEDWEGQPCWENEETGEWEYDDDYDAFFSFEGVADGDYCQKEVEIYQNAIIESVDDFFAEIEFIGNVNAFPVYLQKKVTTFWTNNDRTRHSDEERNSLKSSYSCGELEKLPEDWCIDFINAFGEERFKEFIQFTIEYHVNDLHGNNVAYRNGKPCIADFSGYWE